MDEAEAAEERISHLSVDVAEGFYSKGNEPVLWFYFHWAPGEVTAFALSRGKARELHERLAAILHE